MTETEKQTYRHYHFGPDEPEHIGGPWYWGGWDVFMPTGMTIQFDESADD